MNSPGSQERCTCLVARRYRLSASLEAFGWLSLLVLDEGEVCNCNEDKKDKQPHKRL